MQKTLVNNVDQLFLVIEEKLTQFKYKVLMSCTSRCWLMPDHHF